MPPTGEQSGGPGTVEVLCEGEHLALKRRGGWEYVGRRGASSGVMIVAITAESRVVLVEEDRPPVQGRVISLPAGLVGDEGEEEAAPEAARRELLEETGFECDTLDWLGEGPVSPGLTSERILFFLARGVRRSAGARAEEGIVVHEIPLADVLSWSRRRSGEGVLVHPMIWAGLYLAAEGRETP